MSSLLNKLKGKSSGGGIAAAFGLPVKATATAAGGGRRSRSRDRAQSRSPSYSRSPSGSRSQSPSGSGSGSETYSEDESHYSSARNRSRSRSTSRPRGRSSSRDRQQQQRARSKSKSPSGGKKSRQSTSKNLILDAPKPKTMAGVRNARKEEVKEKERLAEIKRKQEALAAKAKRAMHAHATTGPGPKRASSTTRPASATVRGSSPPKSHSQTSTFYQAPAAVAAGHVSSNTMVHKIAKTPVAAVALPPCTCTSTACREEFRVVYETMQSHAEASAAAQDQITDLKKEISFLRKQLQLYRMEGAPRLYSETLLGGGAAALLNNPDLARSPEALTRAGLSTGTKGLSEDDDPVAARRRKLLRERERERRMEEAKNNALLDNSSNDRQHHHHERRPSGTPMSPSHPLFTHATSPRASLERQSSRESLSRPNPLFTDANVTGLVGDRADRTESPRFVVPHSVSSPSHRIASGRAFGGAGSERLDVGGTTHSLTRMASGRLDTFAPAGSSGDDYERSDLVAELNGTAAGGTGSAFFERRHSGSGSRDGENLLGVTGTQNFDIAYADR